MRMVFIFVDLKIHCREGVKGRGTVVEEVVGRLLEEERWGTGDEQCRLRRDTWKGAVKNHGF